MHLHDTIREMIFEALAENDGYAGGVVGRNRSFGAPSAGLASKASMKKASSSANATPQAAEALATATKGSLCQSCVHRATCFRPGRLAGVWHCEDYF